MAYKFDKILGQMREDDSSLTHSIPAEDVTYNNATSGLTATDAQAAIDELDALVDANTAAISSNNSVDSTGVLTGGVMSTGGGAAEYSISDGTGQVVDNLGNKTLVSWTGKTNITPTNIASTLITFVGINVAGNVVEQASNFTPTQRRSIITLGVAVHVNLTTVDAVNNEQQISYNAMSTSYDLAESIGFFNINGNVFSSNGANVNIDKTVGTIFKMGSNYDTDINNPHQRTLSSLAAATFQYRFSDGSNGVTGIAIDPDNLDDGAGGLTAVGNNQWSVQRIYSFTSNNVKIQRAQFDYATSDAAISAIGTEGFVTEPSIVANGLLRGYLVLKKGVADLSGADAIFLEAAKFGAASGSGGGAITDLQTAYQNSLTGNITTNATQGAVTVQNGHGTDDENVYEAKNLAGTITAFIQGDGDASFTTVNGRDVATDGTKLDTIETNADVTDATNVDAAGAVMNTDATTAAMSFVIDEDNMVSDLDTKVPTQQSVKAYVDTEVATAVSAGKSYQGGYDANTNNPDLDSSPIAGIESGDIWDVTVAGTFFTEPVQVGDTVRAKQDNPTLESHWVVLQGNLTPASIKTQYESNANTNAYTDSAQTTVNYLTVTGAIDLDAIPNGNCWCCYSYGYSLC
jgi:hypothetical protein